MEDQNILAEHLRELRARLCLTQKEFASRIGVLAASLSAYETGVKAPQALTMIRIAKEFNISLDWLCGIVLEEEQEDYKLTCEDGLKHFAYILKTFDSIEYTGCDTPDGDIKGALTVKSQRLAEFLKTLNNLISLNRDGALDDSMLDACVKRACADAAPGFSGEGD